jgi:pyrroline-5-carboxylate reductase
MRVAIIGCGVMGSALARHFIKKASVILCDHKGERGGALAKELGAEVYSRQSDAVEKADIVVLAVKPKNMVDVSEATARSFSKNQLLISVLAGTPTEKLKEHFPKPKVLRVMPNLALICGQAVIGIVNDASLDLEWNQRVKELFSGLGLLSWLPETQIEALTALTGSGPAFLSVIIEAMIDSGLLLGFTLEDSREYVLKTIEGTVALLRDQKMHPADLKWKVASPGGTTISGLQILEESGIRGTIMKTFAAAYSRAREMHFK